MGREATAEVARPSLCSESLWWGGVLPREVSPRASALGRPFGWSEGWRRVQGRRWEDTGEAGVAGCGGRLSFTDSFVPDLVTVKLGYWTPSPQGPRSSLSAAGVVIVILFKLAHMLRDTRDALQLEITKGFVRGFSIIHKKQFHIRFLLEAFQAVTAQLCPLDPEGPGATTLPLGRQE